MAIDIAYADRYRKGGDTDTPAEFPEGLDPVRHRIIATHVFGWRPVGVVAAQVVQDLAFRRKVQRLHAKGPRLVAELLAEIGAERSLTSLIEAKIEKYVDIDDAALDATGARDLPPAPLHEVEQ